MTKFSIWKNIVHPLMERFRRKRARRILSILPDFNEYRVLDLGGSRHFWEKVDGILSPKDLVILNVEDNGQSTSAKGTRQDIQVQLYDG